VKIYTKTGDAGETGLFGGGRVPKDDLRVAAYGAVDETNAAVGTVLAHAPEAFESNLLQMIQRTLFTIGAELATPKREQLTQVVGDAEVAALEAAIDKYEATLPPLKNFILPNGTVKANAFHVARTVCRRAERSVVTLSRQTEVSPAILRYLNRLSDLLFVLARATNAQAGRGDVTW
jgi:cob(I)alamin adenosyltransferase